MLKFRENRRYSVSLPSSPAGKCRAYLSLTNEKTYLVEGFDDGEGTVVPGGGADVPLD
jgi:hypothetical protein